MTKLLSKYARDDTFVEEPATPTCIDFKNWSFHGDHCVVDIQDYYKTGHRRNEDVFEVGRVFSRITSQIMVDINVYDVVFAIWRTIITELCYLHPELNIIGFCSFLEYHLECLQNVNFMTVTKPMFVICIHNSLLSTTR